MEGGLFHLRNSAGKGLIKIAWLQIYVASNDLEWVLSAFVSRYLFLVSHTIILFEIWFFSQLIIPDVVKGRQTLENFVSENGGISYALFQRHCKILTLNLLNLSNGIIHLSLLELSIIIFRDIKMNLKLNSHSQQYRDWSDCMYRLAWLYNGGKN